MQQLVGNLVEAFRRSFSSLEWMGPETRAAGDRQARRVHAEDRLPRRVARLLLHRDRPDDLVGNVAAQHGLRGRPQPRQDRPADRPHRVVHAAADGQRLLHAVDERDRLPGRHPAAAVLRPRGRRRRQLRRHRRGHRSRARARLRRPGLALRRHGSTARLVDRGRPRAVRRAVPAAHRAVQRLHPGRARPSDHKVNGGLTVGENIGDLGGLQIGYSAYRIATEGDGMPEIDGFTGPQRFFIGWAQVWRGKAREAEAIRLLAIDPHSPQDVRGNAVRNVTRVPRGVRGASRATDVARPRSSGSASSDAADARRPRGPRGVSRQAPVRARCRVRRAPRGRPR